MISRIKVFGRCTFVLECGVLAQWYRESWWDECMTYDRDDDG